MGASICRQHKAVSLKVKITFGNVKDIHLGISVLIVKKIDIVTFSLFF